MAKRGIEAEVDEGEEGPGRYRAPALEKGLDILELISRAPAPMAVPAISKSLGRSSSELFRMVQVLDQRGYIRIADNGSGYVPTAKLFALGMEQAPIRTLQEVALPVMRQLSGETDQSCHLALRSAGDIVIVARMESAGLIGYSVRLGYRHSIPLTASGIVLYAFQSSAVREAWEREFSPLLDEQALARFRRRADKVARQGYEQFRGDVVPGIVDLSAPILRGDSAAAALTIPFVPKNAIPMSMEDCLARVREAARAISSELAITDVRV